MNVVEVVDVVHHYRTSTGARPVLDRVDISVPAEDVVAVVGESGCGKTTLGRLVAGLARPTAGVVRFEGANIWRMSRKAFRGYRRGVQVVQQDPYASFNPGLTVREIVGAGMLYHGVVDRKGLDAGVLDVIATVGLEADQGLLRRYPHQLSGGERQRLAIARAISLHPSLIVADEAVSMLDVSMRVAVLDLMLSLKVRYRLAYLFISHDLGVVRYFARGGQVVVMFYGVVVEEGPTDAVIGRPRHPYSYLLLQAVPVADPALAARRRGHQVDISADAAPAEQGCVFANRCPFVEPVCRSQRPPLVEVDHGHRAACFFPERVPAPGSWLGVSEEGSSKALTELKVGGGRVPRESTEGRNEIATTPAMMMP